MRAVIGLGNPGSEYEGTRHNVGFAIVDAIARELNIDFLPGVGEYLIAKMPDAILIKPLTYMNNSGSAVQEVIDRFRLSAGDLLVVADDFHLPLGTVRLRQTGSAGGHNGLGSIIWYLQNEEFPRLRCGIGSSFMPADKDGKRQFVLSSFEKIECEPVQEMIRRACGVVMIAMTKPLQRAADRLSVGKNNSPYS